MTFHQISINFASDKKLSSSIPQFKSIHVVPGQAFERRPTSYQNPDKRVKKVEWSGADAPALPARCSGFFAVKLVLPSLVMFCRSSTANIFVLFRWWSNFVTICFHIYEKKEEMGHEQSHS